ncbi:MAG: RuBisCO accumulation factor 1 [Kovacikia sp.]
MTDTPQDFPKFEARSNLDVERLLLSLRRKEGNWLEWGQACQTLQKAGYDPQSLFEETGFEPIQQNQIIVAAQVYASILDLGVSEAVKNHFERKGSDVLYELRILNQTERAALAALAVDKNLDMDEVHEAAKAVKEYSRLGSVPEGFTEHPGDAIAYQAWKQARQKTDLQARSHLIARGLRFAHSNPARKRLEQLLTDFSVTAAVPAPRLPIYRLEEAEELPRILPVVGKFPLTKADFQAVPLIEETEPFRMVKFSGTGAWVPIPGWQVIRTAEDPVVLLCGSDILPAPIPGQVEEVLVVLDRAQREWSEQHFFLVEQAEQLQIHWSAEKPEFPMLGKVILIMRPRKVLDENYTKELWQIDE